MVTLMGKNLLAENGKLTEIPDNISWENLKSNITIPSYITRIGKSAFSGVSGVSITLNEGLKTIDDRAFLNFDRRNDEKEIIIPSTVEYIGADAFSTVYNSRYKKFIIKSKNKLNFKFESMDNLIYAPRD